MNGPTILDIVKGIPPGVLWGGFVILCVGSFVYAKAKGINAADIFLVWYWVYIFIVPLITLLLYMWRHPSARIMWIGDLLLVSGMFLLILVGTIVITALPALVWYFILKRFAVKYAVKK